MSLLLSQGREHPENDSVAIKAKLSAYGCAGAGFGHCINPVVDRNYAVRRIPAARKVCLTRSFRDRDDAGGTVSPGSRTELEKPTAA